MRIPVIKTDDHVSSKAFRQQTRAADITEGRPNHILTGQKKMVGTNRFDYREKQQGIIDKSPKQLAQYSRIHKTFGAALKADAENFFSETGTVQPKTADVIQRAHVKVKGVWFGRTRLYNSNGQIVGRVSKNKELIIEDQTGQQRIHTVKGDKNLRKINPISVSEIDIDEGADPDDIWISTTRYQRAEETEEESVENLPKLLFDIIKFLAPLIRGDLEQLGNALGIDVELRNYAAVLIDLNRSDLINAIENQAWSDSLEQGAPLIVSYLEDAVNFNACFDGANRLVETLGTEDKAVTFQSGGGVRDEYPLGQQIVRAETLIEHLDEASEAAFPSIFRIHIGGHGFTLIVNEDTVYKLETLAGASEAGTLLNSIITGSQPGSAYTIEQIERNFRKMTSRRVNQRTQGASEMGWNAGPIGILSQSVPNGAYDRVQNPMTLYWTASNLASREAIVDRFANKIQANRQILLEGLGAA